MAREGERQENIFAVIITPTRPSRSASPDEEMGWTYIFQIHVSVNLRLTYKGAVLGRGRSHYTPWPKQ